MDLDGLVDAPTLQRLRRAEAGEDVSKTLRLGAVEPGEVGVLRARVVHVEAPRSFSRRNGSQGTLARVKLDDGTGEADLVLWDDEARHIRDGTIRPDVQLVLRGVQVKAGYRGGIELGLGPATLEVVATAPPASITGTITAVGDTEPVDGRFRMELEMQVDKAVVQVVLWDEAVKAARRLGVGTGVRLEGVTPHPMLDGHYLADGATVRAVSAKTVPAKSQPPTTSDE